MKMIVAVIKPSRLDAVLEAVTEAGASGLTVTEVRGYGRQRGKTEVYRGTEYTVDVLPKTRIDVVCEAYDAEDIANVIVSAARSGRIGDGKVWISPIDHVIRIRTGETDEDAL
jgi:nitrogen regulatory protein PII